MTAMRKILSSPAPYSEHPSLTRAADVNWEAVRVFVGLVRAGSFRAASSELGMAANTVRRQVELLERDLGTALVVVGATGVELTDDGARAFRAAEHMERSSFELRRVGASGLAELSGVVRVSVTEGIGTFWVMPRIAEMKRAYPKLMLDLNCTMRPPDPGRLEADIGIQITPPTNPELKTVRLGRMHSMPFATKEYLETFGRPKILEDVPNHQIVVQLAPQLFNDEVEKLWPNVPQEGFVSITTNTSTAHFWAVAGGAGLGMLPTYLWAMGARVEPVDIELGAAGTGSGMLRKEFDIWMTYHPSMRQTPRVAAAIDWIKRIFDSRTYPWFRDEFTHPRDMIEAARQLGGPVFFSGRI